MVSMVRRVVVLVSVMEDVHPTNGYGRWREEGRVERLPAYYPPERGDVRSGLAAWLISLAAVWVSARRPAITLVPFP